jgi:hypothetical protein
MGLNVLAALILIVIIVAVYFYFDYLLGNTHWNFIPLKQRFTILAKESELYQSLFQSTFIGKLLSLNKKILLSGYLYVLVYIAPILLVILLIAQKDNIPLLLGFPILTTLSIIQYVYAKKIHDNIDVYREILIKSADLWRESYRAHFGEVYAEKVYRTRTSHLVIGAKVAQASIQPIILKVAILAFIFLFIIQVWLLYMSGY